MMEVYCGDRLTEYLRSQQIATPSGESLRQIKEYLGSDSKKILCICGLDVTGKTTLMLYAMAELADPEHTLYIICPEEKDSSEYNTMELKQVLKEHAESRYIFIDEVTRMSEFVNCASILAWYMPIRTEDFPYPDVINRSPCPVDDRKMVITGRDSLSIIFAVNEELWNCSRMLYMDSEKIPATDNRYIDECIAGNIARTLENYQQGREDDISYGIRQDESDYRRIWEDDPDWVGDESYSELVIRSIRVVFKFLAGIPLAEDEYIYLDMDLSVMHSISGYLVVIGALPEEKGFEKQFGGKTK